MIEKIGLIAAVVLPFWNIPLMIRMERRKSSSDISPAWALGVFACLVGMLPSGLRSADLVFKVFTVVNLVFFSGVVIQVIRYRSKRCPE